MSARWEIWKANSSQWYACFWGDDGPDYGGPFDTKDEAQAWVNERLN